MSTGTGKRFTLLGSLRNRLAAGMLLLLGLVLAMAFLGVGSLRSLYQATEEQFALNTRSALLATELVRRVSGQVRVAEAYLLEPSDTLRLEFTELGETVRAIRSQFALIEGLTPRDQAILRRMEEEHAAVEDAYRVVHAAQDQGRLENARALANQTRPLADALIEQVEAVMTNQRARSAEAADHLRRQAGEREAIVWLLVLAAIGLGFGTAFLTIRSIDAPLRKLTEAAHRFGRGDLRPIPLDGMPAELAKLAGAMGTMGTRLRGMVSATVREAQGIGSNAGDLSAMSEQVAASSHEIATSIAVVASGAGKQVREVRGTEQLLAKLLEGATHDVAAVERVASLGESTRHIAGRQGGWLAEAGKAVLALRDTLRTAADESRQLNDRLEEVTQAAEAADRLSSSSEVLALNMSVEVERTGDGREGLSAVADETRRLAETSRRAAENVAGAVGGVRRITDRLLESLQAGTEHVLTTEAAVQRSALAFEEIGRLVDAMREIAIRVAASAEESRALAVRFADLRGRLEGIAQENVLVSETVTAAATQQSQATGDIAASAASLREASERLTDLVAGFQT